MPPLWFLTHAAQVLGSAVNPVLREGNSDRRAAPPVKAFAQKNPHKVAPSPPHSAVPTNRTNRRRRPIPVCIVPPYPAPSQLGKWDPASKTHVAHMSNGDFYGSEKSHIMDKAGAVKIELVGADGKAQVLKAKTPLLAGEVIDAAVMSKKALRSFLQEQIADAKRKDILFSLHLKVASQTSAHNHLKARTIESLPHLHGHSQT